ncbi:DUF2062 domain-containing protein [Nisaea acidiphila]|uniref:DUF2062 domain-containing protein n=1 Tax=Nisaea acidiphila TaxID=1862145 RepID=A0A9J7AUB7_9PROT|nr:DUF2062 domain-containing protein [Nisaea acidiphila]UUX50418.1 DUF2062 domain-containing protein [Nisaea acidiphila]
MFKRRHTLGIGSKVREFVWPRMGFARLWRYMGHRLGRMQGTPYSIAAGFACGAAASFTPLIGFHFILAGLLAWAIRANILASAIGTAIGNPWTFPFIWLWTYKVGSWIVGSPESEAPPQLTFDMIVGIISGETLGQSLDLLLTMLVGGVLTGLAVWVLLYLPLSGMIHGYRARKIQRRAEAVARQTAEGRVS